MRVTRQCKATKLETLVTLEQAVYCCTTHTAGAGVVEVILLAGGVCEDKYAFFVMCPENQPLKKILGTRTHSVV